ncbi:unnamed protein product [Oppiella nova]|uniref:Nuclear export mediator factor NEMF n=1 Tax=Oppiella nova TaxID=334625 RepID=A0A7R9LQM5_9ACAR|nr:unnamed protein product [Oppiella nova]CAG2165658.1 unnamed protein product [Oppiella nova]
MKTRFSTLDITVVCHELRQSLYGMRVHQIYCVDNKTYLIRFHKSGHQSDGQPKSGDESAKEVLLLESGVRLHSTQYEWPKSVSPNGFTMKLRKHLKNKRLEAITQLGVDRIVDLQFGSNEAAYHVILELYDRGNIVITDYQYVILNILRPRKLGTDEDVNLVVKEKYRTESAKTLKDYKLLVGNTLKDVLDKAKDGENLRKELKKVLNPYVFYGTHLMEHSFIEMGLTTDLKINKSDLDLNVIEKALELCQKTMDNIKDISKGYIIQREEKRIGEPNASVISYLEFHPILFNQFKDSKDQKQSFVEMESFDKAVDMFFSSIEGQKIDAKALNQEKEAMKKLEKVKTDHKKRIEALNKLQEEDIRKAELIENNNFLVENALLVLRSAIANQLSWEDIQEMIDNARAENDLIATRITSLKLNKNHFTMRLNDPYDESSESAALVDIDIDLSAFANARKYYDRRRIAAKKEQKTVESSEKAFKSAEHKALKTLKEVAVKTSITKARKVLWFEKFLWFISSDNYIVIAGRDAQQNELIVKRYMKAHDLYVHADTHGATSVVIKNSNPLLPIPPKTLNEAGEAAICYSAAWEAKTIVSAFWVHPNQVSKTAPSGEYLTVGSFMIRGKKNYLPLSQLVMGFGFVFKLDDESTERHRIERKRAISIDMESVSTANQSESHMEEDVVMSESESENEDTAFPDTKPKLDLQIKEETNEVAVDSNDDNETQTIVKSKEPRIKQTKHKIKHNKKSQKEEKSEKQVLNVSDKKQQQLKRGQKSKLKKIKEKYKDQDEEERKLRMAILGHLTANDDKQVDKRDEKETENEITSDNPNHKNEIKDLSEKLTKHHIQSKPEENLIENNDELEEDEEEEAEATVGQSDDVKIIDTLTGVPLSEDNLMYAIPVCGPYSAINGYKYKVKVMPGSSKRGKAAKTALQLFLRDKTASQRERDLLKVVKDLDISKNIPAKVKITALNLSSVKGKK